MKHLSVPAERVNERGVCDHIWREGERFHFIQQNISLSIAISILSIYLYIHLYIYLSIYIYISISIYLSIYMIHIYRSRSI